MGKPCPDRARFMNSTRTDRVFGRCAVRDRAQLGRVVSIRPAQPLGAFDPNRRKRGNLGAQRPQIPDIGRVDDVPA